MLTCADCQAAKVIAKDESAFRKPYNILCRKHGTVEPAISFYIKEGKERLGPIPALTCFIPPGYNRVQAIINNNIPQKPLSLDEIKKYVLSLKR